jgi:L-cysteine S-thiosulfotransferase
MNQARFASPPLPPPAAGRCATAPPSPRPPNSTQALAMMKASFRDQGIAKVDRIQQDLGQSPARRTSRPARPWPSRSMAEAWPASSGPPAASTSATGARARSLAQNGRGMTWTDTSTAPRPTAAVLQLPPDQQGRDLLRHHRPQPVQLRQEPRREDVRRPAAQPIVEYTWGKLWNSKAYNACSNMPRFGHAGLLTRADPRHDGAAARPEVAGQPVARAERTEPAQPGPPGFFPTIT